MWWVFFVLFILISIVSSTLLFYALRRINQYESLIIQIQQIVELATIKMKQVDSRGHYESDDETGFFLTFCSFICFFGISCLLFKYIIQQ